MVVKGGADKFSRKDLDKLQEFVKVYGAKALAYLKLANGEFSGSVAKVVSDEEKAVLKAQLGLEDNDLLFMVAAKKKSCPNITWCLKKQAWS